MYTFSLIDNCRFCNFTIILIFNYPALKMVATNIIL